jgi:hypothetical protein
MRAYIRYTQPPVPWGLGNATGAGKPYMYIPPFTASTWPVM